MNTRIAILIAAIVTSCTALAKEDAQIEYAGLGRYTCKGTAADCAQIDSNNRIQSEIARRRDQEVQDQADRYIRDTRRREQEYERRREVR